MSSSKRYTRITVQGVWPDLNTIRKCPCFRGHCRSGCLVLNLPRATGVGAMRKSGAENLHVKSLSRVRLFATPWTVAHQAPPSMGFSRQEYWSGLPFPSPGDFPNPGIEPRSPALQADALTSEPPEFSFTGTTPQIGAKVIRSIQFLQIITSSPSPTESKILFLISVSLLLSHI